MLSVGVCILILLKEPTSNLETEIENTVYTGKYCGFQQFGKRCTESNMIWKLLHSHKENILATLRDVPDTNLSLILATKSFQVNKKVTKLARVQNEHSFEICEEDSDLEPLWTDLGFSGRNSLVIDTI